MCPAERYASLLFSITQGMSHAIHCNGAPRTQSSIAVCAEGPTRSSSAAAGLRLHSCLIFVTVCGHGNVMGTGINASKSNRIVTNPRIQCFGRSLMHSRGGIRRSWRGDGLGWDPRDRGIAKEVGLHSRRGTHCKTIC